MKKPLIIVAALVAALAIRAGEVRLNGASTTVNAVINPGKAAVEAATGLTLKVTGTNTGKGLAALLAGECDASLTSEPLDVSMLAGKFAGLTLNASDFQLHQVKEDYGEFVVHPSNPVSKLGDAQVKGILAGEIANWKDVGGPDLPIVVLTDPVGAGTRTLVQQRALGGGEYGPKTVAVENVRLVAGRIAELKGGFGFIGHSFVTPTVKVVETTRITRPLGFLTKGAPGADVQKVIDAFRAVAR
ncbi:MAG TPA: substrate-binding domain-containing protein [Lacunisphaera sp.]|nr:substrate-binding domain-containing protein [Lacunisphaera sp.]